MLLEPHEIHHFEDFGYGHAPYMVGPANAKGKQLLESPALDPPNGDIAPEREGGSGCRCLYPERRNFQNVCINTIQQATHPKPWPNRMGW